jgi:hypothetical protein
LLALLAGEEKAARTASGPPPQEVAQIRAAPRLTRAHLALARADTAEALRRVLALPDSVFAKDWRVRLLKFQLLAAAGRDREAAGVFDAAVLPARSPLWVLSVLERGRIAERRSQRETDVATRGIERTKAAECYQFVADVWRHGDPELTRYVAEANAGLARLAGEGGPG